MLKRIWYKKVVLLLSIMIFVCFSFTGCNLSSSSSNSSSSDIPDTPIVREQDTRSITEQEYTINNTVAVDSLGRVTLSADGEKNDKTRYVGIFFFCAVGNHASGTGIYDVTKILEEYGRDFFDTDTEISPANYSHHWGEPVFGYYKEADPWVIRKQIEMLTMIGIDFLVFDCSNGPMYENVTDTLFEILIEYREKGWDVPKCMYMMGGGGDTATDESQICSIYNRYYSNPKYEGLWFKPNGKPMIICQERTVVRMENYDDDSLSARLSKYFEFRYSYWPTTAYMDPNSAAWCSFSYPQKCTGDWLTVSVAQHPTVRFSDTEGSRGRGWNYKTGKNEHETYAEGVNYENQWKTATQLDNQVTYTFITAFNEWVACKYYYPSLDAVHKFVMVDAFNAEYSRDIEPSYSGDLKDNFYLQTFRNIRNYKCSVAKHYIYEDVSVGVNDFDSELWEKASVYRDFTGECMPRNFLRHDGDFSGVYLTDDTNRNDIDTVSVMKDGEYLYFRITTVDPVTAYQNGDTEWMNIRIRTKNGGETDSLGYHYAINREVFSDGTSSVQRCAPDGSFASVGRAEYFLSRNVLCIKVPLNVLKLSADNYQIEFKVNDNISDSSDVLSFYNSGDSAPIGGLSWQFGY